MSSTDTTTKEIYDLKSYDPRRSIGGLLGRVKIEMSAALDAELAPLDITAAQYVILMSLALQEAGSASGLCKGISYDPGAMTRMLDRLDSWLGGHTPPSSLLHGDLWGGNAGVDALELSTSDDLVDAILRFADLRKRRSQLATGGGLPQHLGLHA